MDSLPLINQDLETGVQETFGIQYLHFIHTYTRILAD